MQNRPSIIWAWALIACFVAIVVRRYVIRPWRYRKFSLPRMQPLVIVSIDEWPDEFRAPAMIPLRALAAAGFTALGYFKTDDALQKKPAVYETFWLDRSRHDIAVVSCRVAPRFKGDDRIAAELVITRSFDDGTDNHTVQIDRRPHLSRPSTSRMVVSPQIGNPADVIAIHRHWIDRGDGDLKSARVDELDLEGDYRRFTDFLIGSGDFRLNADGSKLVPTTRGIYAMTWRRLWPMREWREMRDRAAGARVVRAWERAKKDSKPNL